MISKKKKYIYIFGTGGLSEVISEIIIKSYNYSIKAYIDNGLRKTYKNKKVYTLDKFIENFENEEIIIAVGENIKRKFVFDKLSVKRFKYPNIVCDSAFLSTTSKLGKGNIILSKAILNNKSSIKNFCLVNSGSILEHDCIMNSYSQISPGTVICGNCKIGKGAFIGANSTIIQNKKIGDWSIIGAGSLVLEDVNSNSLNFGSPSQKIKNINTRFRVFKNN